MNVALAVGFIGMAVGLVVAVVRMRRAEAKSRQSAGDYERLAAQTWSPDATPRSRAAEADPSALHAAAGGASVLVVEDEPQVRELIKAILVREGHHVVAVAGPHDGLAALKRQPPVELMLVDVVMPHMDGYDLAIQARAIVPGLRVIFMSGFASDLARLPPGDRFLAKPFANDALHEIVRQALLSDRALL